VLIWEYAPSNLHFSHLLVESALHQKNTRKNKKIRFRPILMTSFATIMGIMPIAIGLGAGATSRRPMGVVVAAC
jgi:multidrug efflux pump subunit AcrB